MGADLPAIPGSVEASPETVDARKLAVLREQGVDRLSLGVQSFVEAETRGVVRPQQSGRVGRRSALIRRLPASPRSTST